MHEIVKKVVLDLTSNLESETFSIENISSIGNILVLGTARKDRVSKLCKLLSEHLCNEYGITILAKPSHYDHNYKELNNVKFIDYQDEGVFTTKYILSSIHNINDFKSIFVSLNGINLIGYQNIINILDELHFRNIFTFNSIDQIKKYRNSDLKIAEYKDNLLEKIIKWNKDYIISKSEKE
jgi:hypothetical protein